MRDHVFDHFRENPIGYGSTYFAHPVCCAVAYATLQHVIQTNLVSHVKSVEPTMKAGLAKLVEKHPSVKSARTTGLGGGFDLAGKDGNFLMHMHEASQGVAVFKEALLENGLITLIRGHHVHCTPPLIISSEQVCVSWCIASICCVTRNSWSMYLMLRCRLRRASRSSTRVWTCLTHGLPKTKHAPCRFSHLDESDAPIVFALEMVKHRSFENINLHAGFGFKNLCWTGAGD